MDALDKEISRVLVQQNIVSQDLVDKAVAECKKNNCSLLSYLLTKEKMSEDILMTIVSDISHMPYVNLKEVDIADNVVKAVPAKFAWYYEFIPIKLEGNRLTIAVSAPLSIRVQDEMRVSLRFDISPVLAKKEHIIERLKFHYGLGSDTVEKMVAQGEQVDAKTGQSHAFTIDDAGKLADDASVIKLVNQIVLEAYKKRATDIHIEPFSGKLRLRYRIDGILRDQSVPENFRHFLLPILSRLKIMASLDISERRMPQDGKTSVKTQDQFLDLRLSFIPTPHGESVVLRILPRKTVYSFENLGFLKDDMAALESLIKKPSGILFVTGPTGSGKTTTLYACLKKINKIETKVITIEDPIEYEIDDVTQIQVNPDVGLTFAAGLRSMLRHDPDVIMVGEVRDKETAEIAIRVALTGHLVLSTLHTNDAATGVTRLIDIGIEPYLIASSVEAFIAQRLVRCLCPHCKAENKDASADLKRDIIENLNLSKDLAIKIYKGTGCAHCNFTGFFGRMAIYEILIVDNDIKKCIIERKPAADIKRQAMLNGMKTLMQNGWLKMMDGSTTPEEVLNVCQDSKLDLEEVASARDTVAFDGGDEYFDAEPELPRQNERRLHLRVATRINIQVRLIEKGAGDIFRLNPEKAGAPNDLMARSLPDGGLMQKVESAAGIDINTISISMSAGGMAFESSYLMPVGSIIEIKFSLPGSSALFFCLARVVRVEKNLPKCFYVAVCYLDMSGSDRSKIQAFVKTELQKQART